MSTQVHMDSSVARMLPYEVVLSFICNNIIVVFVFVIVVVIIFVVFVVSLTYGIVCMHEMFLCYRQ